MTDYLNEQIEGLRRELKLIWDAHEREHSQHELAHAREHKFAQDAIDKAAEMAKANKADANEWRASMNDREGKFATKTDVVAILDRLDKIERAGLVRDERERLRIVEDAKDRDDAKVRVSRSQWIIGISVGLVTFVGGILVNLALR